MQTATFLFSFHVNRTSDLETNGDSEAFSVNDYSECKLIAFSNQNTWSRLQKRGRIKQENNKALAYATYEIPTLAFMDRLLQTKELKIFCVSGKQKGAGLTTLISHKAEDK